MKKEEILKRSREMREDEGVIFIANKGMSYGILGLSIMFFIFAIIYLFCGGNNMNVPFAMITAYQGAEKIGKYSAGKAKKNLIFGVALIVISILFCLAYLLIDVLGVIGG